MPSSRTRRREEPLLLTVVQAADLLNVHHSTVYEYIKRGDLPATDVSTGVTKGGGGRTLTRIKRSAVEAFIERRTRTTRSAS